MTQSEFAEVLGVSTVLISMIETGQKQASKNFIVKLAGKLEVQASSIMPFIFFDQGFEIKKLSKPEKLLLDVGEKLQEYLITVKAKKLKKYV